MSESDKRFILARRQRLVHAAVASAGIAAAACDPSSKTCDSVRRTFPDPVARGVNCAPMACLSVSRVDAGAPTPCLSMPLSPADAGKPDAGDGGDGGKK
jgi:hypothetical protein